MLTLSESIEWLEVGEREPYWVDRTTDWLTYGSLARLLRLVRWVARLT